MGYLVKLTEGEIAAIRTNEKLIVNLCYQIIQLGNTDLNNELRNQLIDTYLGIKQAFKVESKALTFLLKQYGSNVQQMVKARLKANP